MSVSLGVIGVSQQQERSDQQGVVPTTLGLTVYPETPRSFFNPSLGRQPARSVYVSSETSRHGSAPIPGPVRSLTQSFVIQAARNAFSPLPPLKEV